MCNLLPDECRYGVNLQFISLMLLDDFYHVTFCFDFYHAITR